MTRTLALLGSTGSIGTQALDVVERAEPGRFRVVGLASGGGQPALLAAQVARHRPDVVAVESEDPAAVEGLPPGPELLRGPGAAAELARRTADVVVNGIAGATGLTATLAALQAGRVVGLANKESLVAGGPLVLRAVGSDDPLTRLLPVDSEHSALWQCLAGARRGEVARLWLTASGGPFRGRRREELADVTPAQALAHPTWRMGPLVTVNSATLVNKALEVVEAQLLFGHLLPGAPYERVGVVVHPQSVVHSMVEYVDGSTLAQLSPPDMRLPISLALDPGSRVAGAAPPQPWDRPLDLRFEPLDETAFPAVAIAKEAGRAGGTAPAVYTAADEECVAAFLAGHLPFLSIVDTVERVLAEHTARDVVPDPTLEDVLSADAWARARARELVGA